MRRFPPEITPHLRLGWRWPDALRAMRHRNFRLFFFGQLVSLTGTWMQYTAQQWLVYRITGSQLSLGAVTFANFLPVLLLSLFMGVIIDRLPRRRLLVLTQTWFMLGAATLAVLTFSGLIQYWHIIGMALVTGIANALDMPTRQAFYVDMVEKEDLLNAIALSSSVMNGARIVGPAIGGFVIAALGEPPAFLINALSYLAVILGLLLMKMPSPTTSPQAGTGIESLRQALNYVVHDRRVFGLVGMLGLYSLLAAPFVVLLPAFARDVLAIGAEGLGGLMAARGLGALVGAMGLAFFGDRRPKGHAVILGRGVMAIGAVGLAISRIPILSMLSVGLAGFALIIMLASTNTLIQLAVPDDLRGRVMSTYSWAIGGFWPLGSLLLGWLGDRFGATNAVLFAAAAAGILVILGLLLFPETKQLE